MPNTTSKQQNTQNAFNSLMNNFITPAGYLNDREMNKPNTVR